MKFSYKKYAGRYLRPVIPIEVTHGGISLKYEVLVDSGADLCIFDAEIGGLLSLDMKSGERLPVSGITGVVEYYYAHEVTIRVGGQPFKVKVGFLKNFAKFGYGVVGQVGFFDMFVVKFDLLKSEIELKPRKF
ncbi:MAG: hypothetical protein HYT48_02735 [Candidatus Vogelbacteria bacterium]|nr:hypothetical protein [Candidatus Vogelbacteria bacterium]